MTIKLPKGYRPPEGAKPGEPFEVVAMLMAADDGSFTITTVDGIKLDDDDSEEESEEMEGEEMETEESPFNFPEYASPEAPNPNI